MHWICKYFESSNNSKPKSNIFPIFPSDICWWITLALDLWYNVSSFPPPPNYICKLQGATWTTTTAWACSATGTTPACSMATTPTWWATAAATPSPGEYLPDLSANFREFPSSWRSTCKIATHVRKDYKTNGRFATMESYPDLREQIFQVTMILWHFKHLLYSAFRTIIELCVKET